jgi:hypothetical protein
VRVCVDFLYVCESVCLCARLCVRLCCVCVGVCLCASVLRVFLVCVFMCASVFV